MRWMRPDITRNEAQQIEPSMKRLRDEHRRVVLVFRRIQIATWIISMGAVLGLTIVAVEQRSRLRPSDLATKIEGETVSIYWQQGPHGAGWYPVRRENKGRLVRFAPKEGVIFAVFYDGTSAILSHERLSWLLIKQARQDMPIGDDLMFEAPERLERIKD